MAAALTVAIVFIANVGNVVVGPDPLASEYGRLVFSTLVYRHGDRSIENTFSSDPYKDESYWPMGLGQLTFAGIEKHFELGKWLRERYDGWLPEEYSTNDVYVRSSDYDRTIMSAEANLMGMYPPVGSRNWSGAPGKRVQLVPIHTVSKSQDKIIAMSTADCPAYSKEFDKLENDLGLHKFYYQFRSVFKYIKNHTNLEMNNITMISAHSQLLYYSFLIESQFYYTLPEWSKTIFPEPLTTIIKKNFELSTYTNTLKRLKAGVSVKEIVTRLYEKKNGTLNPDRKLWIYSAHDTTIVNLLNTMGIYRQTVVPYAAVLMIELRLNDKGSHVVTISYRNTSNHVPYLLHVPGCDSVACKLDQLIDVLKPVMLVDWEAECKIKEDNQFSQLWIKIIGLILAEIILMLIVYAIVIKVVFYFRKSFGNNYQSL